MEDNPFLNMRGGSGIPSQAKPNAIPVPTPSGENPFLGMVKKSKDLVFPLNGNDYSMTGSFGDGHYGEDYKYNDRNKSDMKNPMGGVPFTGTIRDNYNNMAGYGNYYGVIGASPEELAQMSPEEKRRMYQIANEYMANNPLNIEGMKDLFPGKNINVQGHLQDFVPSGDEIGTGSAQMRMGSTGHSTGKHLHEEFMNTRGTLLPFLQLFKNN